MQNRQRAQHRGAYWSGARHDAFYDPAIHAQYGGGYYRAATPAQRYPQMYHTGPSRYPLDNTFIPHPEDIDRGRESAYSRSPQSTSPNQGKLLNLIGSSFRWSRTRSRWGGGGGRQSQAKRRDGKCRTTPHTSLPWSDSPIWCSKASGVVFATYVPAVLLRASGARYRVSVCPPCLSWFPMEHHH